MNVQTPKQRLRLVADRAADLRKLKDHPSWGVLEDEWATQRDLIAERLQRKLLAGGKKADPIDQREIDYERGFIDGAEWILNNPDKVESALDTLRKRAGDR